MGFGTRRIAYCYTGSKAATGGCRYRHVPDGAYPTALSRFLLLVPTPHSAFLRYFGIQATRHAHSQHVCDRLYNCSVIDAVLACCLRFCIMRPASRMRHGGIGVFCHKGLVKGRAAGIASGSLRITRVSDQRQGLWAAPLARLSAWQPPFSAWPHTSACRRDG